MKPALTVVMRAGNGSNTLECVNTMNTRKEIKVREIRNANYKEYSNKKQFKFATM